MTSAELCERLAMLLRAGYGLREALIRLPDRVEQPDESLVKCARRAALGVPLGNCIDPVVRAYEPDLHRLGNVLVSGAASGANSARALEDLATALRRRQTARGDAENAGAGATLSARMMASLPLLFLPLAVRQMGDPAVAAAIVAGVTLGVVGYRWLLRVIPVPTPDDPQADLAHEIAAALSAGRSLDSALRTAAETRGSRSWIRKANLGFPWSSILEREHPHVARAIVDARDTGTPIANQLVTAAAALLRTNEQAFERAVRRAPVKMIVPLTLCILPSFVLVAIVPLLRGLAQPS